VSLLAVVALTLSTTALVATPAAQAAPPKGLTMKQAIQSHPTLKVGQRDKAVKYLKRQLGMKGKYPRDTKVLKRKILRFERREGLPFDRGKVTGATWRALGVPYSKAAATARKRASAQATRSTSRASAVLREAARHAGKPYAYGGNGPYAFDCSGYTRYVFNRVGVNLPRTAAQQRGATRWISRSQVRPGDLVFVHSGSYVSHVAIYAGNNMWWESSRPGKPVGKNPAWTSSVSYGRV
jgi:cell wall-associated NlpC family hydrolase